jgi:hypothetical protein
VSHAIEAGIFDENVEAVQERAGGNATAGIGMDRVLDNSLLANRQCRDIRLSGDVT